MKLSLVYNEVNEKGDIIKIDKLLKKRIIREKPYYLIK